MDAGGRSTPTRSWSTRTSGFAPRPAHRPVTRFEHARCATAAIYDLSSCGPRPVVCRAGHIHWREWRPGDAARWTGYDPYRRVAGSDDPDAVFDAFAGWAAEQGLTLYPHQEEALIEIVSGANVILTTPTGSGKSLVATGAHFAALADGPAHLLHRADQGAGVGEVLRALRDLRRRATSA